jgi:hypothetical protein
MDLHLLQRQVFLGLDTHHYERAGRLAPTATPEQEKAGWN